MRTIRLLVLFLYLWFLVWGLVVYAQNESIRSRDAIVRSEERIVSNTESIIELRASVEKLRSDFLEQTKNQERVNGVGIGVMASLTVLQSFVVLTSKKGKES